jgi:D-glycero-alpha-D-manno-heptose-7-phosphate kinase
MIIATAPYRVSFAGGGTDLPAFYRHEAGAVLSVTIAKHMYVTVSPRFEPTIRVSYTRTEIAKGFDAVEHTLVREALRMVGVDRHVEITTIGDLPGGTGMGSSSSLTCGLLKALYAYRGDIIGSAELAERACRIEIDILGKPIGRQDQYASAYGGLNFMRFYPNGAVDVEPVPCRGSTLAALERWTTLFYTGRTRDADGLLQRQSDATLGRMDELRRMRDLADEMRQALSGDGDLERFAAGLHEGWELKRSLSAGISDGEIDDWYNAARRAGALGGKLLGAGGGGFVLLLAPPERHEAIREAVGRPREIPLRIDPLGTRLIFISDRHEGGPRHAAATTEA